MTTHEQQALVAPCGIDCGVCEFYLCQDNPQLRAYVVANGVPPDKLPCAGCRNIQGNCPALECACATYQCATERNVAFCFECSDFPCAKLNPAVDRATLPHNIKVFNLCVIQRKGVEGFLGQSADIKQKYYKGKMVVGEGPQI